MCFSVRGAPNSLAAAGYFAQSVDQGNHGFDELFTTPLMLDDKEGHSVDFNSLSHCCTRRTISVPLCNYWNIIIIIIIMRLSISWIKVESGKTEGSSIDEPLRLPFYYSLLHLK